MLPYTYAAGPGKITGHTTGGERAGVANSGFRGYPGGNTKELECRYNRQPFCLFQ